MRRLLTKPTEVERPSAPEPAKHSGLHNFYDVLLQGFRAYSPNLGIASEPIGKGPSEPFVCMIRVARALDPNPPKTKEEAREKLVRLLGPGTQAAKHVERHLR